ncbi:MAG: hydrogenase maturation nickel metallochaperone HypA [Planctomycetota bacterium]
MHEMSIARNLIDLVQSHLDTLGDEQVGTQQINAGQIVRLHLRVGALSCVHQDALKFSFEMMTADTSLANAELVFQTLPVRIFCTPCDQEVTLPGIQRFRCPICDTPSADIRQGQELDLDHLEWVDAPADQPTV